MRSEAAVSVVRYTVAVNDTLPVQQSIPSPVSHMASGVLIVDIEVASEPSAPVMRLHAPELSLEAFLPVQRVLKNKP